MKLSVDFGRWTTTKAALAIAGALAIAAAGSAIAMSPIVTPPIKWAGGAEFKMGVVGRLAVYAVPAGRSFILTDLMVANAGGTAQSFSVYAEQVIATRPRYVSLNWLFPRQTQRTSRFRPASASLPDSSSVSRPAVT